MATLQSAKAKLARKKATMPANHARGMQGSGGRYSEGMGRFLGRPVRSERVSAFTASADDASRNYGAAINRPGYEDDWESGVIRAMT